MSQGEKLPSSTASTNRSGQGDTRPLTPSDKAYEKAWKYVGYRGFSRMVASHEHFLQVRLYRTLNARVILAMQDHLSVLEGKLDKLDTDLSREEAPDVHNGTFRSETSKERFELVWELRKRLKDYNDYILSYAQLSARDQVHSIDTLSMRNWLQEWPNAIRDEEVGYLDHDDDLIYITEKPHGSLRHSFQNLCLRILPMFRKHPKVPEDMAYIMDHVELHNNRRANRFLAWILMILALFMLVVPLWLLSITHSTTAKLGIITGCISLFLLAVACTTNARAFESLGATAAYCAVLVVFLQAT